MDVDGTVTSNANFVTLIEGLMASDVHFYIQAGIYTVASILNISADRVTIQGASGKRGTTLQKSAGSHAIIQIDSGSDDFSLLNIELDGNGESTYGGLVYIPDAASLNRLLIKNCRIYNATGTEPNGSGINIDNGSGTVNEVMIENCEISNVTYGIKTWGNINKIWVLNNYVHDIGTANPLNGGEGIYINGKCEATAKVVSYIVIQGNICRECHMHGIRVSHNTHHVTVDNNICYECGDNVSDTGDGMSFYDLQNAVISNNVSYNNDRHGMSIWSNHTEVLPERIVIDGNVFDSNAEHGIRIGYGENVDDVVITDNIITNNGDDGINIDVASGKTANDYVITGNRITGNANYGISTDSLSNYHVIVGNNCRNNSHANYDIYYAAANNHEVAHNIGRVGTY